MRRTARSLAILIAFLGAVAPVAAQQGAVQLRYRFQEGQSFRMRMGNDLNMTQTMMGQSQSTKQSTTNGMLFEVLTVDAEGVARVRATYESNHVVQETPMGRTEYDSENPPATLSPEMRPYALMVGESFTADFAANGAMSRVEGMEDLMSRMLDGMDLPPGVTREQMEEMFGGQFGSEAMAEGVRQSLLSLPEEPVAVGDSWSRTGGAVGPIPVQMESTWTVRERRDGKVLLDVHVVTSTRGGQTMEMAGMSMSYDLAGEMSGTVEIDEVTGWTIRSNVEGNTTGSVTIGGGPMGDMSIPMTMHIVSTSELIGGQ